MPNIDIFYFYTVGDESLSKNQPPCLVVVVSVVAAGFVFPDAGKGLSAQNCSSQEVSQ